MTRTLLRANTTKILFLLVMISTAPNRSCISHRQCYIMSDDIQWPVIHLQDRIHSYQLVLIHSSFFVVSHYSLLVLKVQRYSENKNIGCSYISHNNVMLYFSHNTLCFNENNNVLFSYSSYKIIYPHTLSRQHSSHNFQICYLSVIFQETCMHY